MRSEEEPRRPPINASPQDERVQFALRAARMGVFEWHPHSDVLTWSSRSTGLGVTIEDAPTSGRAFFELVHPDDRAILRETRARAIRHRTDVVAEFRILRRDGVVHWVQARGRIVYHADGTPRRVLGVNADITDLKCLQDARHGADVEVARLHVLKATMRTVQDIVSNALMSLQLFRLDAEPHVSLQSLAFFDDVIMETAAKLRALSDLERVCETHLPSGSGIAYESRQPDGRRQGGRRR